jgi:hypothetical protein
VTVRRADLVDGFQRLGIEPRATVLVHSAMRTLGYVEGGGDAVVRVRPDPARGMSPTNRRGRHCGLNPS